MPRLPQFKRRLAFQLPVLGLAALALLLAACQPQPLPVTVEVPVTRQVTVERVVTASPPPTLAATSSAPRRMAVCLLQEPPSLNRFVSNLAATLAANEALYDGLVDLAGYQHQPVAFEGFPSLANGEAVLETVEVSVGDRVFDAATGNAVIVAPNSRVRLRQASGPDLDADFSLISTTTALQLTARWTQVPGLTWEDGTPVTSQDALLAFAVASSPAAPLGPEFAQFTAAFEALDEQSVRWTGLPGYANETYYLNHAGFMPSHIFAEDNPSDILADPRANFTPLAYGPFKLEEWVPGEYLRFTRNPSYWRAAEDLPRLDELLIRFVPDTDQVLAQLLGGSCDAVFNDSALADRLPLLRQMEAEGVLDLQMAADTAFDQLSFNALPGETYTGFAAQVRGQQDEPIFSDARIRQAIAHCIDRQALIDQGLGGAGLVQQTYAPPDHPLYAGDGQVTIYDFDPAAGLALLAEAGWVDTDRDGLLDNGDGQPLSFAYSSRNSTLRQTMTRLVQQQLRANCKIEPNVELYGSEYTEPSPNSIALGRRFDVSQLTFRHGGEPLCSLYLSSAVPSAENGWRQLNITGYSNPAFDQACLAAYEAGDEAEKAAQHALAQQIWSADLPAIILYAPVQLLVTRPSAENVLLDASANSGLWNVENFAIRP